MVAPVGQGCGCVRLDEGLNVKQIVSHICHEQLQQAELISTIVLFSVVCKPPDKTPDLERAVDYRQDT
jgi:hypothetical protein